MNWINNFIEEQKIKAENKEFLKSYYLDFEIENVNNTFETFAKMDNLQEKKILKLEKEIADIWNHINSELYEIDETIKPIIHNQKLLLKNLSHQKGRITRQTKEQNLEKKYLDTAFKEIYQRLGELENK